MQALWAIQTEFKQAVRGLMRSPAFTLLAVLTLGLGIAANTALFTVLNAAFFHPLGVRQESRVLAMNEIEREANPPMAESNTGARGLSYLNFVDWRKLPLFTSAVLIQAVELPMRNGAGQRLLNAAEVTSGLAATLGVVPLIGRDFSVAEEIAAGSNGLKAAMISETLWRDQYAHAESVLQNTITIDEQQFQIVGVMPDDTLGTSKRAVDVWLSRARSGDLSRPGSANASRGYGALSIAYARLADGISLAQASAALTQLSAQLAEQYPDSNRGKTSYLRPLRSYLNGDQRQRYLLIFCATLMLLLIACANLAGLLSARVLARSASIASREIFGASRKLIALGLLIECALLASAGVLLGLLASKLLLSAIAPMLQSQLSNLSSLELDWRVIAFAAASGLMAAILSAIIPARFLYTINLAQAAHAQSRSSTSSGAQNRQRKILVTLQIALSTCLLIGALLMLQSLRRLVNVQPGFQTQSVLMARVSLPSSAFPNDADVFNALDSLRTESLSLPGSKSVSFAQSLPLTDQDNGTEFDLLSQPAARGEKPEARLRFIDVDYSNTLVIPLSSGREFGLGDSAEAAPVMLVNQAFVARYFKGRTPEQVLGQNVQLGWGGDAAKTIVGVLGNVRHRNLAATPEPEMYVPVRQFPVRQLFLIAKLEPGNAAAKSAWVNRMQQRLATVNVGPVQWLEQARDSTLVQPKLAAVLFGALALSALFLSAVGLFALMHFLVSLRQREFGLRMALGAAKSGIFALQLRQSLLLVLLGCALGAVLAGAGGALVRQFLFETQALDAASFALAIGTMLLSGALVSLWPSWRASSADANSVLR